MGCMTLKFESEWDGLFDRLHALGTSVPLRGVDRVKRLGAATHAAARTNLEDQGRGGQGPPLSKATLKIYAQAGDPDGRALLDRIELTRYSNRVIVGIPDGKPTTIARVQDRGAIIPVTDAMRGYLAAHGIHLRQSTQYIQVPPRGFWTRAIRDSQVAASLYFRDFFKHTL